MSGATAVATRSTAVSRTNVYILVATALLGILLIIIQSIVDEAPPPSLGQQDSTAMPAGNAATRAERSSAGSSQQADRLGHVGLLALLEAAGIDGQAATAVSRRWLQERGFLGANELLGIGADEAPIFHYESLETATLEAMGEEGDIGALQTLAARNLVLDPFAAMDFYTRAAAAGSEFAMLQIASLLETFADLSAGDDATGPVYRRKLMRLRASRGDRDLREDAFAFALAAIRGGDLPIAQPEIVDWIDRMAAALGEQRLPAACNLSARIFFEVSGMRRNQGRLRLSSRPPPVFVALPNLTARLPCGNTPSPVDPVLDTSHCRVQTVLDGPRELDLYICP